MKDEAQQLAKKVLKEHGQLSYFVTAAHAITSTEMVSLALARLLAIENLPGEAKELIKVESQLWREARQQIFENNQIHHGR